MKLFMIDEIKRKKLVYFIELIAFILKNYQIIYLYRAFIFRICNIFNYIIIT